MGIVIRTLYNNQNWQAPCVCPSKDSLCSSCFDPKVHVQGPKPDDEQCSTTPPCWEQELCTTYEWGATKGKEFGKRARPGMLVFLVFGQPEGNYTLWGRTTIDSVNVPPIGKPDSVKEGYLNYIRCHPFKPLPRDKWVKDLRDIDLVDKPWKQGRYRFISGAREAELEKRIEGSWPEKPSPSPVTVPSPGNLTLNIVVTPVIYRKLESAANEDGRQIDEVVREAIAEWLRGREK